MALTNTTGIDLCLAVWLAHDNYDYQGHIPNYISVTTLLRPIRQIILAERIPYEERIEDITDVIARRLGQTIHDSIEQAWTTSHEVNLKKLGYPQEIIDRVKINPTNEYVAKHPETISVYLEQRRNVEFGNFTIGGKFDLITEGILNDTKTTSVWTWIKSRNDEQHQLQMSLYRWIDANQDIQWVTEDFARINYIFTDWQKSGIKMYKDYPDSRVKTKELELLSLQQTEDWVNQKLKDITNYRRLPEDKIPECTDEELWRSDPKYKYYADLEKAKDPNARSTKNFDTLREANAFMASKGGKGIVKTVPGEVKACGYCPAFNNCSQKDRYL